MSQPLESSLARICNKQGQYVGIGVLIAPSHLLTCAHVVADALGIPRTSEDAPVEVVQIDFPFQDLQASLSAQVIAESWRPVQRDTSSHPETGEDIAVLLLDQSIPAKVYPAQFVQTEKLENHRVDVYGVPSGHPQGVWAEGRLIKQLANGWVQLESVSQRGYQIEPGFSGSPIWDRELQAVVGITVATDPRRPDARVGFAIPTEVLALAWSDLAQQVIPPCPYRGLFPFREQDAEFFCGREPLVDALIQSVNHQPFTTVIGPSGSGKSSIIFAGLMPQLRPSRQWLIESFRPGDRPFWNLAASFVRLLEPDLSETDQLSERSKQAELLAKGSLEAQDIVVRILEKYPDKTLLLVIDQLEELYTLCPNLKERRDFLNQILLITQQAPKCRIVASLRADFMGFALSDSELASVLQNDDIKVGPMTRQELKEAIIQPAFSSSRVTFEEGLVDLILSEVTDEPNSLPLLEFTLEQLWPKQTNGVITFQAYTSSDIGGVTTSLINYANDKYHRFNEEDRLQIQKIFVQLVRPGEGTADTRRLASRLDLGEANWALITRRGGLADSRLVVTGQDSTGQEIVEVVHEALIQRWQLLRDWMQDSRSFRVWQELFRVNRRQWQNSGEDKGTLLRGKTLIEASDWQQKRPDEFSKAEIDFIYKSRQRELISRFMFGAVGVIVTGVAILFQQTRAENQRQFAENQRLEDFSSVLLGGAVKPELIHVLPRTLQVAAQQAQDHASTNEAIEIYKSILRATNDFIEYSESGASDLKDGDLSIVQSVQSTAEESLTEVISTHFIKPELEVEINKPKLEVEINNSPFGARDLSVNDVTEFENQYTDGALKTTYKILMRKPGLGLDEKGDNNGRLGPKELELFPCDLLKEIEELWRQSTNQRCGLYSENFYEDLDCQVLEQESLAHLIFQPSFDNVERTETYIRVCILEDGDGI